MRCLVVVLTLLALAHPLPAAPPDLLAALGAFQAADQGYREALGKAQGPQRARLLERRLVLADLMGNPGAVAVLCGELEKLQPDPLTRLSIELARGNSSYRLGNNEEARRAFARVARLAAAQRTPQEQMAMYACKGFEFWDRTLREGRPTPEVYHAAYLPAFSLLQAIQWPQDFSTIQSLTLDLMRTNFWNREWLRRAAEIGIELSLAGQTKEGWEWGTAMAALAVVGRTYGNTTLSGSNITACNSCMAWRYSYDDLMLEQAEMFCNVTVDGHDYSQDFLAQARQDAAERQLLLQWSTDLYLAGKAEKFTEDLRQRARLARAEARYAYLHGDPARAWKEFDTAAARFEEAGRFLDALDVHLEVAGWMLEKDPANPQIRRHLAAAREGADRYRYTFGHMFVLAYEGSMHYKQGQFQSAEGPLRAAVMALGDWLSDAGASEAGKRQVLARAQPFFDMLIQALLKQGKQTEALDVLNLQQSQGRLAQLPTGSLKPPPKASAAYAQVERVRGQTQALKAELQAVEAGGDRQSSERVRQRLADNKGDYLRALNQLKAADPAFAGAVSIQPTSFVKIKDFLPEGVLLVQYGMGPQQVYLFVARRGGLQLHEVKVSAAELRQDVATVRQGILGYPNPLPAQGRQALSRLYTTLIGPLEEELASARLLVVAPSRELSYLPFACLLQEKGDRYLIEQIPLAVITGLELLEFMRTPRPQLLESLVALGNPDGSLPAAAQEVASVAALFPTRKVYLGAEATRERLSHLQGVSVLHLATHGVLDSRDVNGSYLLLANGHLPTGEIYGLDLEGLGLVTLSACQTALARQLGDGAELASLAQAFSVAGGQSMLASLWSVSDEATSRLMVSFYENLLRKKLSRAAALQQAQVAMLRDPKTAHPFLWAAFQLLGDWR